MEHTRALILNFIKDYTAKNHYAPTMEEIRAGLGLSSKSLVDYHLKAMVAGGQITMMPKVARSIVVVL
jgi:SOS-response transcriptional repressor LexA